MSVEPDLVLGLRMQIADRLRSDVLSGRLTPGERLNEVKLVERFGVSRTPIREALQQLTHEGLLEGRPNAGVKVASRPPDSIRELVVPIRRSVEIFALRSFFSELTPTDLRLWDEILQRMRAACEAHDYPAIAEQDLAFHRAIIRRAGQKDLEAIWITLIARIRSHFQETQEHDYAEPLEIYEEHARIIGIFRSGNLDDAVAALEDNIA
jgi:GntR family transcriptional regulator, rspAB operon transcriptional repressor